MDICAINRPVRESRCSPCDDVAKMREILTFCYGDDNGSPRNEAEAMLVTAMTHFMVHASGVDPARITVLTPYKGQLHLLRNLMKATGSNLHRLYLFYLEFTSILPILPRIYIYFTYFTLFTSILPRIYIYFTYFTSNLHLF
jgi:hypothetical protein